MYAEHDKVEAKENLTKWVNEPTLASLKEDVKAAQIDRETHISDVNNWMDNFEGKRKFKVKEGRSKLVPKLIRKQAEWRYTALSEPFLSTDNIFKIDPVTFEDKAAAFQNALVLNNQFNTQLGKVNFIDEYVRTGVDEGTVIVKVAWENEEIEETVVTPVFTYTPTDNEELLQRELQIEELRLSNIGAYNELPDEIKKGHEFFLEEGIAYIAEQTGTEEQTQVKTLVNKPLLEICEFDMVTVDPTCKGVIDKAQFIVHEFSAMLSDLKKDGRYKNLDAIPDTASDTPNPEDDSTFTFNDKPRKKLDIIEYWGFYDIDDTGIVKPFVCAWIGDVKVRMETNPYPDQKLPFVKVSYLPVRKKVYGQPDGYLLEDNQKVIGAVTRSVLDIMGRNAAGQRGMRKDALDTTNKLRYDRGEDYEFNPQVDPKSLAYVHQIPEIPNSAMQMVGIQNQEAESITGVKAFSEGITGTALGSVASLGRNALDAASKREMGILRRFAEGLVQIGRKVIAMNSEFLEEEEVVRITNEEFVTVKRDDLAGNFDLKLGISTAEADNEKAQELAFMLQTGAASADPGEVRLIRAEIARLRKMPDLAKRIEEYRPEPDPLAVKEAQLRIALLEAQVYNEQQKGMENAVDVQLKQAKTATEQAKARGLHSESDQKDLDFVEQRTGQADKREADRKDHDKLNQLDLKAADSFLSNKEEKNAGFLSEFKL